MRRLRCFRLATMGLALLVMLMSGSSPSNALLQFAQGVEHDKSLLQDAQQSGAPEGRQAYLWALLGEDYEAVPDFFHAEEAYNKALHIWEHDPTQQGNYATALDNLGALYLAYSRIGEAAECRKKAREIRLRAGDALGLARSQERLAEVALVQHRFKDAAIEADEAYVELTARHDPIPSERISALVTAAIAKCMRHDCSKGRRTAEQALAVARENFAEESVPVAHSLLALGLAQSRTGDDAQAEQTMLQGIHILEEKSGPSSPAVLGALYEYRDFLEHVHRREQANALSSQLDSRLSLLRSQCAGCSTSVHGLVGAR
jgi:tetratricopeptide (TPR) repeat protein